MEQTLSNVLVASAQAMGAEKQLSALVWAAKSGYLQKLLGASNPPNPRFHGKVGRGKSSRKSNRSKRW